MFFGELDHRQLTEKLVCCKTNENSRLFRWIAFFFGLDETKIEQEHTLSQEELWHGRFQQWAQVLEIGDKILSEAHHETFRKAKLTEVQYFALFPLWTITRRKLSSLRCVFTAKQTNKTHSVCGNTLKLLRLYNLRSVDEIQ